MAATYNAATTAAADILSSSMAVAATNGHYERTAASAATTTTFIVPSSAANGTPLQLEPFIAGTPHFVTTSSTNSPVVTTAHHHQPVAAHQQQQHHQHTNSTSTSYTFVQIKREPCQVSEVTSANCHQPHQQQQQLQHHHHQQHQQQQHTCASSTNGSLGVGIASSSSSSASIASSSTSKTMSASSTLTTLVKIEASSPKVSELDKGPTMATLTATAPNTNNSVPIGIAVARKRPQESSATLSNSTAIPVQQSINKDLNCFGIRVADLGGVGTGCGNIYFTGNGDLMGSSATTAEELALSAAGVQSMNRAPSTFWQYPNALPIESVISMSPATVGLQYSRDASRGQVVLLPATPAALGISNFPLYTPTDPFQQAAAFVWPSYIPQGTTSAAAAAAATLQPPPNFIFPSMSPHSTLQPQSYATSLQLFGSNYLTAAAAAAAAAAATSTLCQHNQQTNSTTSSINLSLGAVGTSAAGGSSTTSSSTSSRFLSLSTTPANLAPIAAAADTQKTQKALQPALTLPPQPTAAPLIIPPSAMKIEEWTATDFMSRANSATTALAMAHHPPPPSQLSAPVPAVALNFESRDKTTTTTTTTTNLLELQNAANTQQALNLMRLPTPPTSATIETAAVAATAPQLSSQILFQATSSPSPALLNLSASLPRAAGGGSATVTTANFLNGGATTLSPAIGPPTPLGDETALNFKTSPLEAQQPQIVVGVPRVITNTQPLAGPPPQMQDVNIQTDTPVCSEDESSSCPLAIQQQQQQQQQNALQSGVAEHLYAHDTDTQQPLELTKPHASESAEQPQLENGSCEAARATNECHNEGGLTAITNANVMSTAPMRTSALHEEQYSEAALSGCEQPQSTAPLIDRPVINSETAVNSSTTCVGAAAEDLTGLELLSNISTSTLASKNLPMVRVKQEPIDHTDTAMAEDLHRQQQTQSLILNGALNEVQTSYADVVQPHQTMSPRPPSTGVEPLGGLNLLCALAEQRIQEEVQSGGGGLFSPDVSEPNEMLHHQSTPRATPFGFQPHQQQQQQQLLPFRLEQSFPSMEGIELPTTSGMCGGEPVKRKKHKHSKSSKLSTSAASVAACATATTSGKKSQRCSKKGKKYSKEKRKHKLLSSDELDFDDEQLQEELKSALDPSYQLNFGKWQNAREIFELMESNMRMRLADITRQYRKKKRKLDEISKNKKKKKCSKLLAAQQQQQQQTALSMGGGGGLSLVGAASSSLACGSTSLPLCDYKFPKFSNSSTTGSVGSATSSTGYLNRTSFLCFGEKAATPTTHAQFPPPDVDLCDDDAANQASSVPTTSSMAIYKPVRLGPSALAGAVGGTDNRGSSILRLTQRHAATDNSGPVIACKERKLMTVTSSSSARRANEASASSSSCNGDERSANTVSPMSLKLQPPQVQQQQQQQQRKLINPMDRELMLTSDHLYRKETRVLTDMGGLFYAGIMKPLQPPDVYAITLDGERGNKSHIMSREEIFKDTILEVAPKSIESVPIGTRLCAYWSQQYRCLYPGRAIESESSDDGETVRDFVSVEFDDGDSGRIRLQNIRFLLSDYPIVEYNDNPLYSLGKHKKSGGKSGGHAAHDVTQQHDQPPTLTDLPTSTASELQTNAAREVHAQRSEKKRIKSLKKKTQAALAASTTALNGATSAGAAGDTNDLSRKHHKHKKRKKHKKHHHRKANADGEGERSTFVIRTVSSSPTTATPVYVGKSEQTVAVNADEQMDDDTETVHAGGAVAATAQKAAQSFAAAAIKLEAAGAAVKVKTEHLDLEEESGSNMMSEVSDENKCDDEEVEHNNSKGSKIAAFLPERQLWGWLGKAYRKAGVKGRARKQFYKTIKRGKETITVGDCAVFLSTGRPDRPYIGRIESMWETTSSNKVVRVRWFYHPEETTGCPNLKYPGALFESPHEDENDVQTISHRCEVLPFGRYFAKFGADSKQYQSIYDNNDTYYLAGYYNPRLQVLNLQDDIPTLETAPTDAGDDNATANV